MSAAGLARGCLRCHRVKPGDAFPERGFIDRWHRERHPGNLSGGIPRICWACIEGEAWALHASGYMPNYRREFMVFGGVTIRWCNGCRRYKPVEGFPAIRKVRARTCKPCRLARLRVNREVAERREGDRLRARATKRARERRRQSADVRSKEATARRKWEEKMKADPAAHARYLESERLARRLRNEREGRKTAKSTKGVKRSVAPKSVPAEPLMLLVERRIERRRMVENLIGENRKALNSVTADVCRDLGITDRTYRRWRDERGAVRIGVAERVLLNADVEWHEVYSYDDHAAAFLAAEVEA